jgi:hypothetical protein
LSHRFELKTPRETGAFFHSFGDDGSARDGRTCREAGNEAVPQHPCATLQSAAPGLRITVV